jgi:hypothetical protein
LISTKYIPKGEEICDNYGIKNNIELLLYYGFTLESNPNPVLSFDIGETNYFFNLNFDMDKLNELSQDEKIKLKMRLENIYRHHLHKIVQSKNPNITNIFRDEIKITKLLLVNL